MKIIKDDQIMQAKGNGVVLAGGCFDILHPGHVTFLKKAKALGQTLVILLESDENIRKLKGKDRPFNNQRLRTDNLLKLGFVDFIVLLALPSSSEYYYNLVKLLHPAIIAVTKDDHLLKVKEEQAKLVGGIVIEVMKRDSRYSTSNIAYRKELK